MKNSSLNSKWLIDYLPDEIFDSLTDDDRQNILEYRKFQLAIKESMNKIENYQKKIERLKGKINSEMTKIAGTDDDTGLKLKLEYFYSKVSHLDKNFKIFVYIERRKRSSKSLKSETQKQKKLSSKRTVYRGKKLTETFVYYGKVGNQEYKKSIYLGKEERIRSFLEDLFKEDWSKDSYESIRDELKILIEQYSRYKIFHLRWDGFLNETHNIESIKNWIAYCTINKIDRYQWKR